MQFQGWKCILLSGVFSGLFLSPLSSEAQIPTDLKQMCTEVGAASQSMLGLQYQKIVNEGTAEEIYNGADATYQGNFITWIVSMAQRIEARHAAYAYQLKRATLFSGLTFPTPAPSQTPSLEIPPFDELRGYLEHYSTTDLSYPTGFSEKMLKEVLSLKPGYDFTKIDEAAPVFCSHYFSFGCASGLKKIFALMAPRTAGPAWLSLPELTVEVLSDEKYGKPLAIAALKIMNRIRALEAGQPSHGKILSDLVASFQEAGFNEPEATERA